MILDYFDRFLFLFMVRLNDAEIKVSHEKKCKTTKPLNRNEGNEIPFASQCPPSRKVNAAK